MTLSHAISVPETHNPVSNVT